MTTHHFLDRDSGAPGAAIALAEALDDLRQDTRLLSHDDLPKYARGRLSLLAFPLLVLCHAVRGRRKWDVLDYSSYDGWLATLLPRLLRPRLLAFHSHGLEHVVHDRLIEGLKHGSHRVSWRYYLYRGTVHLWITAQAARKAGVAFFLNRYELRYAVEKLGVDPIGVTLAINGLSKTFLAAAMRDMPVSIVEKPLNIAFIGTYIARKGIEYLLPALAVHLRNCPDVRVLFLGTRVDSDIVLQDLPEDVRRQVRVIPTFDRDELPTLLADSHIFVLPSLVEGFSIAGLEAMACGLVPILTKGHGFEEYTTDGLNGFLIDRGSSEQIVGALERLNQNRDEWARMRSEAIRVARTFTWERAAEVQLAGYKKAIARLDANRKTA